MGQPATYASNAIIYLTYGAFLVFGCYIAWRLRHQSKGEWLSGNRTQTAFPLALNFIASALGSGILFSYPQLATITGVQGVVVYAVTSAAPLMIFAYLGPIIRSKCPEGFVLTEWTRERYGSITALFLSFLTLVTMFLYMVAELSALQQIMTALTGMDGLPMVIVECVVTTIYTSLGGFKISFITDNIQYVKTCSLPFQISGAEEPEELDTSFETSIPLIPGLAEALPAPRLPNLLSRIYADLPTRGAMVIALIIIATITVGVETKIDTSLIESSGLTKPSLLGWQLIYILPVAVLTNDFFLSNFWIRTFASKTDKDLYIGVSIAAIVTLVILTLVGSTGLIATWSGAFDPNNPDQDGSIAFFYLLEQLPAWTVGIVLVMVVSLSTAAFDSFQSAMVSTASNDLFRNRLNIWWVRGAVVLIIFPVVAIALKAPSILQIYLISDLVSASTIPVLVMGLSDRCYWWRGFEVVVGGLGGIFTVFIFGTIYFGSALQGAKLILLEQGLYGNDWSAFGAFVAAPFGGLLWGLGALSVRLTYHYVNAKVKGIRFDALDRPAYPERRVEGTSECAASGEIHSNIPEGFVIVDHKGKFF